MNQVSFTLCTHNHGKRDGLIMIDHNFFGGGRSITCRAGAGRRSYVFAVDLRSLTTRGLLERVRPPPVLARSLKGVPLSSTTSIVTGEWAVVDIGDDLDDDETARTNETRPLDQPTPR